MTSSDEGIFTAPAAMRAMRLLQGWDEITACTMGNMTPGDLVAIEALSRSGATSLALHEYGKAILAAGGIMRRHTVGGAIAVDVLIGGPPADDFRIERFLPSSLPMRAALYALGVEVGDGSAAGKVEIREYADMTRGAYDRTREDGRGAPSFSFSSILAAVDDFAGRGLFFISPDWTGLPGWGLRLVNGVARG